jgi:hypothetical protein
MTGKREVILSVQAVRAFATEGSDVSLTRSLCLGRLVEVLVVNSRLDSLNSALWYSSTICPEANLRYPCNCIKSGGDFSRPATEPHGASLEKPFVNVFLSIACHIPVYIVPSATK